MGAEDCDAEFSSGHPERPASAGTSGGHGHDHGLTAPDPGLTAADASGAGGAVRTATARHRKRLIVVLCITLTVFVVQLIGAFISGSLSLLADAGHMLTDGTGVAIALIASLIAGLPATSRRTFGYLRVEVLAALANGIVLGVIAVVIFVQAVSRFGSEVEVHSGPMLVAAAIGGTANLVSLLILRSGQKESLNVRGAYLEVLGDLLGSLAVIVAGIVIWLTDWMMIDQIASILIALMIAPRAYSLLRDVVNVLLEASPKNLDLEVAREHMLSVPGVDEVHDVHAWTITSGVPAFSAHVTVADTAWNERGYHAILDELRACLHEHFDTEHVTLQLEPESHRVTGAHVHR
ncbi:cation transporter [Leucobacter sp. CSA2]|uniref:Cation transporter n=1 Tax=Leucobacter edaphi TaxID=2796472 RepID=A0A934QDT8_9MICO|nr:cation transporter [Leucobacter edaphi]